MNLYTLLTATRGRQILDINSWPALLMDIAENGFMMTMKSTLASNVLVRLIPVLEERGRIAKEAVSGLTLLCGKNAVEATITAEASGRNITINVDFEGIPDAQSLSQDYLKLALQDDLLVICKELWQDAETILLHTGARYDGAHVFERESRNFIVAAEVLPDLPSMDQPGEQLLKSWLTEILTYSSDVMTIGLVVFRDFGMFRMSEFCLPEVCVIRPNTPVRHWLNREHLSTVTGMARRNIAIERNLTSSFDKPTIA